ncbi:hypothetical protein JKF63_06808 [Porcisia hertigi]|uniref:RRM domain-containing protein n=1 Tax=Porcisia hertigi TaxID=2761500 RepID=A0A836YI70_9TRYP|nr:hypothetical protein JKF63_06808 [Porcisia hertigi]
MYSQCATQPLDDDTLKQSRNVYVASLPLSFDDQQLQDLFSTYGRIVSARIMRAKKSHASKGYGFVMFREVSSAEKSIEGLHGRVVGGSRIQVRRANADASMTFSKVSHTSVGTPSTTSTPSNSTTSVMQCGIPASFSQHVLYSTTIPQAANSLFTAQPPAASYAIVSPSGYQGQNSTPVSINQHYGASMNPNVLQVQNGGIAAPYYPNVQPQQVSTQIIQQQQQPLYMVLLPNGQSIVQPYQFSL